MGVGVGVGVGVGGPVPKVANVSAGGMPSGIFHVIAGGGGGRQPKNPPEYATELLTHAVLTKLLRCIYNQSVFFAILNSS